MDTNLRPLLKGDFRNTTMLVLPTQGNSQKQTIIVISAVLIGIVSLVLVAMGVVFARREIQKRSLREERAMIATSASRAKLGFRV